VETNSGRPFTRNDLKYINELPGNFLLLPGYFVIIFDAYNLLKDRTKFLCLPDITNKKDLSIMLGIEPKGLVPFLIPAECGKLTDAIGKERKINLIFSDILKTSELMSGCVVNATKSFKIVRVIELSSGTKIIQLEK